MQVVVLYESLFGNTREVAEAVAAGVAEAQPQALVVTQAVGDVDPAAVAAAELLIVGGPTHMRGMAPPPPSRAGFAGTATNWS